MAVPKTKTSKARRDSRRSANSKLTAPSFSLCPECGELKTPHRVCRACGQYKGRVVLTIKD